MLLQRIVRDVYPSVFVTGLTKSKVRKFTP